MNLAVPVKKRYLTPLTVIAAFFSFFCMASPAYPVPPTSPSSECGPVLAGAIASVSYECLNDTTMLHVENKNFEWQYAHDLMDGISFNQLGGIFEFHGIAFKETQNHLYFVINGELSLLGHPDSNAGGGSITHGDLFLNLTQFDFKTASQNGLLYAVRYADTNDAGVDQSGVFKNVSAKSVTSTNRGFATLQKYEDRVYHLNAIPGYGDFDYSQTYYALDISLNVIDSGTYIGPIEELTPPELAALGYDDEEFEGGSTIAFRFPKDYIIDVCGIEGGDGKSCLDCAEVACGQATTDVCNICNGDGTSCLDCFDIPFGDAVVDQCGVCDGDGYSCLDCLDEPFGEAKLDQCGVCDGDGTSCLDCADTPFGDLEIDQCGVCGGDGTSCLDCADEPFGDSQLDECGVCNGDGLSCLECIETDHKATLLSYDSTALEQRNAAWRAARLLQRQAKGRKRIINRAQQLRDRAHELYLESWNQTWELPLVAADCGIVPQCVTVSHVDTVEALKNRSVQLRNVGRSAYRRARRLSGQRQFRPRVLKNINQVFQRSQTISEGLPLSSSVCG